MMRRLLMSTHIMVCCGFGIINSTSHYFNNTFQNQTFFCITFPYNIFPPQQHIYDFLNLHAILKNSCFGENFHKSLQGGLTNEIHQKNNHLSDDALLDDCLRQSI